MNREFVPHEQALALKELGFDEPCMGYYLCKNSAFGIQDLLITTEHIDLLPYDSSSCKAPTFSQAFRWFREKYNIVHNTPPIYADETNTKIEFWFWFDNVENNWDLVFYNTYEEAELECLKKLIEIVKTNK
jgi:hypothetical protein